MNCKMTLTDEMQKAFDLIENTNECLYITGKAGTGKTTFLKYIVEHTRKSYAIAASTGIAAINAGGVTLHSLFGIPLGIMDPSEPMKGMIRPEKIELFERLEMIIIDEISMVRPDVLDYIDSKLRLYRMKDEPFGGIQIVMMGDLYQLPPVVKQSEKAALLSMYRGVYFFYAHVFRDPGFRIVELTHVFRQSDSRFVEILNNIRNYHVYNKDLVELDKMRDRRASKEYDNQHVHICALRKDVQAINAEMLGDATHTFNAIYTGEFNKSASPCDDVLKIRVGARVMMLMNDPSHLFYNGSLGEVMAIGTNSITVRLDNGNTVALEPHTWEAKEYVMEEGKIKAVDKGTCQQFPLTLAWAITIHKSQGLTFDKVTIHAKYLFCPGQLYVALSRCTSMEGIITESYIGPRSVIPDRELQAFDRACKKAGNVFNKNTYRLMNIK